MINLTDDAPMNAALYFLGPGGVGTLLGRALAIDRQIPTALLAVAQLVAAGLRFPSPRRWPTASRVVVAAAFWLVVNAITGIAVVVAMLRGVL